MTIKEIIDGLKFTMEMCLYNPTDGSMRPVSTLNDMDKTTYDACEGAIKLLEQQRWIPVSERLPKENEYIGNVCKYYLIQDEYGDMHVAHLSNVGWIPMDSLKAIGAEIIAWKELPQPYKVESEDK